MDLNTSLQKAQSSVNGVVASAIIDMSNGLALAMLTLATHPQDIQALLAGATKDLFEGPTVVEIETIFREHRREKFDGHYFDMFVGRSRNLWHVWQRLPAPHDAKVVVFVAPLSANIGLMLAQVTACAKPLGAALQGL